MKILREATPANISTIVSLLKDMSEETKDTVFNQDVFTKAVKQSFDNDVKWFIFYDETNKPFGTCCCQALYNYWQVEKKFLLGGIYISPSHRGKGLFKKIYNELKDWVKTNNGTQIHTNINENNSKSIGAFKSVGQTEVGFKLFVDYWN